MLLPPVMNGLNASPRKRPSSIPSWAMIPPSVGGTKDESQDDVELESLDGIECPRENDDVASLLRPFASCSLQPIAVVQARYDAVQHRRDKHSRSESIKSWFRCHPSGPLHDMWWTSDIVLPDDVASAWDVGPVHRSGAFPLAKPESESHSDGTDGNELLFDVCGEWKIRSNAVQFKSKKGAQKSAALNLLIALDRGERTKRTRNNVTAVDGIISTCNEVERFRLQYIRYYGAVQNPGGEFVSNRNPCMIQCILSVEDANCNEINESCIDISSNFHLRKNDSFNDAFDRLRRTMLDRGATVKDIDNMRSAMMVSRPNIAFEVTIPKWATAEIESKFYLLELDFSVVKGGDEIPFSEAIGLDANAATRVGIVCGCAVYDEGFNLRDRLSADFNLSSSCWHPPLESVPDDNVRVKMVNQTEVALSEMIQQIERISPDVNLGGRGCPVTLIKCFNNILFDEGKTYGMGGSTPFGEILNRVAENSRVHGDRRSCMFAPICPRSNSKSIRPAMIEVDWKIVLDVVHHETLTVTEGFPAAILRNRFLIQPTGFKGRVFVAKNEEATSMYEDVPPITSTSPLFPRDMISLLPNSFKQKMISSYEGLQLSQISYECFYKQTWNYSIRNTADPLIAALPLTGVSYEQHESTFFHRLYGEITSRSTLDPSIQFSIANFLAARGLLVPELTQILPLPRDFLYLCKRASTFVGKLERNYLLHVFAWRFIELRDSVKKLPIPISNSDLVPLIDKATRGGILDADSATPFIRYHERLESLGDSVLLHFIVLNLFVQVHSSTTEFILDVFEQCITNQGKNTVLYNAALQIGLHRLIDVGSSSSSKSCKAFFQADNKKSTIELARKKLSDTLESLIGATYLIDPSGCMTVGLLNEIGLCLPDKFAPGVKSNKSDIWFHGKGTCLTSRYPFHKCQSSDELEQIRCILQRHQSDLIILQRKAAAFCHLLAKRSNRQDGIEFLQSDPISSLLLQSALYDESNPGSSGLESLAKLRDKIFNVGNAALQLSIVSEIYHLYPASTSGDIHLMKTILMSHDSLAYIFLKNGFHNYLFDENADDIDEMKAYINKADLLGSKEWAKNGGWAIHGGIQEFHRRVQQHKYYDCLDPQYVGLAAGRLIGHTKKLTDDAWEDLQFSMKAIVGAVVLSFGVKDAWDMFRPLFLELIMLSPDELRICFAGISDLVSAYQKGKR